MHVVSRCRPLLLARRSGLVLALWILAARPAAGEDAAPKPAAPPEPAPPSFGDPDRAGAARPFATDFEDVTPPALPSGFLPFEGGWSVFDASTKSAKSHVLRQGKALDTDVFATVFATGMGHAVADGRATVRFQPVSGFGDASGGIAFRARGPGDYYLARGNALEDNFRLYIVKHGVRWQLATATAPVLGLGGWHTLEVEFRGPTLRAVLDGKTVVTANDATFASGWCGLWTKGDSTTNFDDFLVEPAAASAPPPKDPAPSPTPPPPAPGMDSPGMDGPAPGMR